MKSAQKVLIIDDEVEICYLLSRILRKSGIEVSYVNNISDARLKLTSFTPSVIFLDNHLPDGLGIDFAKYLSLKFPECRIIIITAKETNADHAYRNGASEIIFKPFTSENIFSALNKYI